MLLVTASALTVAGCAGGGGGRSRTADDRYDFSSPLRACRSLARAMETRNAAMFEEGRVPTGTWSRMSREQRIQVMDEAWKKERKNESFMMAVLRKGRYRNDCEPYMDAEIPAAEGLDKSAVESMRRVFLEGRDPKTGAATIVEFCFVQTGGQWKLLAKGIAGVAGSWVRDLSTPKTAIQTVCAMVYARDTYGIYHLLAQQPSMDENEYDRLVLKREEQLKDDQGRPRLIIHEGYYQSMLPAEWLTVESVPNAGPDMVRVLVRTGKEKYEDPDKYETFRLVKTEWRWVPKPYYIWNPD